MSEQADLSDFPGEYGPDLSDLTDAEREVFESTQLGEYGVREFARETGRVPGTVGNLLARARDKVGRGGSGV